MCGTAPHNFQIKDIALDISGTKFEICFEKGICLICLMVPEYFRFALFTKNLFVVGNCQVPPRFLVLCHGATEKTVLWHFPCVRRVASQAIVAFHQLVNVTGVVGGDGANVTHNGFIVPFQQKMSEFEVKMEVEVAMRS